MLHLGPADATSVALLDFLAVKMRGLRLTEVDAAVEDIGGSVARCYSALMAGTAEVNKVQQYELARHSILGITMIVFCTAVATSLNVQHISACQVDAHMNCLLVRCF